MRSVVFEAAFGWLAVDEGLHVDDPHDVGGPTYMGVSRTFHPEAYGEIMALQTEEARRERVKDFYFNAFWWPNRLDEVRSPAVANEVFNTAVLCGHRPAIQIAQRACNMRVAHYGLERLTEDGIMGPRTLAALNRIAAGEEGVLLVALNHLQGVYLDGRPTAGTHRWGWFRRQMVPGECVRKLKVG